MNFLDVRTIMFSHIVTDAVCTVILAFLWVQNRKRFAGLSYWLFAFAFQTAAVWLIVLRGSIPDWISMTFADTLVLAGALLVYMGLERFAGKKSAQIHNYILLAAFVAVNAYFVLVRPNLAARNLNVSMGLLIVCFQCVWLALRRVEPGMRRMMREVGLVFGVFCLVSLARMAVVLVSPAPSNDFFQSGLYDKLLLMAYQILLILLAFALALMINRRLLIEIQFQEEKFSKAFHSSPYALTLTRLSDGQMLEVNDGFVAITGYAYTEIIGKTTLDLQLWDRDEDRVAVVSELSKGNQVMGKEFQFRTKSGETITGLLSAEIITIDGQPWVLSSINDVTERVRAEAVRQRAEEALRESEERLKEAQAMGRIGNWEFDIDNQSIIWSDEAYRLYERDPALGPPTAEEEAVYYAPEQAERLREYARRASEEGKEFEYDLQAKLPSGTLAHFSSTMQPVRDASGRVIRLFGTVQDITERKQAETALQEYSEHLEEMVAARTRALEETQEQLIRQERLAMLGQLSGSIAHELRTPLGAIKNAVYLLDMILETPDAGAREALDILAQEVENSEQIINNLLDFARTRHPVRQSVDVNQAVNQALSRIAAPDGVSVQHNLADLPPIAADPGQLGQILGNLLLNAVQAMPDGGALTLRTYHPQPDWVAVSIADTGMGIPPENLDKLFEPLFTTKSKGIGLGLALVKMLVEGHGGAIRVESIVGQGTTFTVELPMNDSPEKRSS